VVRLLSAILPEHAFQDIEIPIGNKLITFIYYLS
jgi:hypothetical protein